MSISRPSIKTFVLPEGGIVDRSVPIHRTPGGMRELVRDHRDRGRRAVRARSILGGTTPARVAAGALGGLVPRMIRSLRWSERGERATVVLSFPFMTLGAAAYAYGALTPDRPAN